MPDLPERTPEGRFPAAGRLNVQPGSRLVVHVRGRAQDGREIDLDDYRGRKILLALYPEDEAAGRTALADALARRTEALRDAGVDVVGLRGDRLATRAARSTIDDLPFPLLEDANYRIGQALDVLDDQAEARPARALVLLDEEGRVVRAWDHATEGDVEAAFRSLQEEGAGFRG